MKGKLLLIPVPLTTDDVKVIPDYLISAIQEVQYYIVEKGKTARSYLKQYGTSIPLQEMTFFELNKRTDPALYSSFLKPASEQGKDIVLMSEAGCPGVADPGADVVRLAHRLGIQVVPYVGPSSILLALMASGLNGQQFKFWGYLPVKDHERRQKLKQLESASFKNKQTQLFIETPYRNVAMFKEILSCLKGNTLLCLACNLTAKDEFIRTATIQEWKQTKSPDIHKKPAVFLILANGSL